MRKFWIIFNTITWSINIIWFSTWIYQKPERDRKMKEYNRINNIIGNKHINPLNVPVNFRLQKLFEEFNKDACKYNMDIDYSYLDEIVTGTLSDELGITHQYTCNENHLHSRIVIDDRIFSDTTGLKFVFYHEMGHYLGRKHTYCDEKIIMNSYYDMETNNDICDNKTWNNAKLLFFRWDEVEDELCMCYDE